MSVHTQSDVYVNSSCQSGTGFKISRKSTIEVINYTDVVIRGRFQFPAVIPINAWFVFGLSLRIVHPLIQQIVEFAVFWTVGHLCWQYVRKLCHLRILTIILINRL